MIQFILRIDWVEFNEHQLFFGFCIFTVKLNICVSENWCVCSKGLKKTEQIQGISKKTDLVEIILQTWAAILQSKKNVL